jgi:hypothetical protein
MDIQSMATQLIGFLGDNPNLISQFVQHPYSTTAQATGTQGTIGKDDMSQILTQVAAQATGQSFGANDVANMASSLLGQNGGSIHALAGSLFGGMSSDDVALMAEIAVNSAIGGIAARGMAQLLAGALGGNKKGAKK